jgi:type IV secretory pathway TraG/TraD family ATPase VirD4
MSTLDKEDGAAIQILMRPANPEWRKNASAVASDKRKGKKKGGPGLDNAINYAAQLATALVKPPSSEGGDKGSSPKKELSNLDQSVIDAIDDKTRYPGYEVLIRLVASSNISQRAQSILSSMTAAFSLFDAPGRNGFTFVPAKDPEALATDYIMRFFPQKSTSNILNSVELATIFHFPDQSNIPTSQLERQDSKQVDGPRNVPAEGLLLGYNVFRGVKKPIRIALSDRQRHMYVVGQTGTGKSTFLENLALQDMLSGNGFAFVDPHGDTAEKLLAMVPRERTEDVIYFSPADMSYPMGLNLFEFQSPDQKDFLIQEALNMLYKLYDPQHQGIMGPRYEHLFRNAALTVMADPAGGTFIDIPKLFRDPKFVQQKLKHVTDPTVIEFWTKEMPTSQRSNEFGEVVSWFVSKFGAFLSNEMMRTIIGQTKSAFDLRDIMDNKKILLVNLSKGRTGDLNSKLLGMIFVMKFQAAAMSRANIPEDERVDFALYVDEFQNFSTDSFATIMSEARKYHLNLLVANQFTTQLTDEIRDAVFGNMGTIVSFRVGQNDVDALTRYFQPTFDADDLLRIPNHNTITRTLIGGVPTQPFSMSMLPPLGSPNPKLAEALKQLSAAKYGRPRAQVEAEIADRLVTKLEPPSPYEGLASGPGRPPFTPASSLGTSTPNPSPFGVPASSAAPAPKNSFLDEWLAKRKAITTSPQASSPTMPTPVSPAVTPTMPTMVNPSPLPIAPEPPTVSAKPELATAEVIAPAVPISPPEPKPAPVKPVEVVKPKPTEISTSPRLHETEAPVGAPANGPDDDTIYIDRDGNLQTEYKDPEA